MRFPSSAAGRGFLSGAVVALLVATAWHSHLLGRERRLEEIAAARRAEFQSLGDLGASVERFHRDKKELEQRVVVVSALRANDVEPRALIEAVRAAAGATVAVERVVFARGVVTIAIDAPSPHAAARTAERLLASPHLERVIAQRSDPAEMPSRYLLRADWSAEP